MEHRQAHHAVLPLPTVEELLRTCLLTRVCLCILEGSGDCQQESPDQLQVFVVFVDIECITACNDGWHKWSLPCRLM